MEKKKSLSKNLQDLEKIVAQLNDDVEIEEAVLLYEKGVKLAKEIRTTLNEAEKTVQILTEDGIKTVDEDQVGKK